MTPKPPKHLSAEARALFTKIADEIELDEAAHLLMVTMFEQYDRMKEAQMILKKEGITVKDRFGQLKPHPAISIERDAAASMMRGWRLLSFDQEPPGAIGRPPGS